MNVLVTNVSVTRVTVSDLHRRALGCQCREAHDVGEEDGDGRVGLGYHRVAHLQVMGHRSKHNQQGEQQ